MNKHKIITREQAAQWSIDWREIGSIVGFTSGVFDLLHSSHVDLLEKARAECYHLIVGLNSDASVRGNKGPGRPIMDETSRARIIAALECVDAVFLFDEPNNNVNIEMIKPDLYIKGGDYGTKPMTSAALVQAYGGKVVVIPTIPEPTTSSIIARIKALPNEGVDDPRYYSSPISSGESFQAVEIILDKDPNLG